MFEKYKKAQMVMAPNEQIIKMYITVCLTIVILFQQI